MFFIANDCQPVQCCGIFVRVLRKDTETRIKLKGWRVNRSARVQKGVFLMVEFSFFCSRRFSVLRTPFHYRLTIHTERAHTHTHTLLCTAILSKITTGNCGALFVSRIKSRVITGSGDRIRGRGFEGQVTREGRVGKMGRIATWVAAYQSLCNAAPSG